MKGISQNLMVLALGIFVLCLVFTAGCTQSTGTSPVPATVSSTPAPAVSWTGEWNDTDEEGLMMTLAQANNSVSGTYLRDTILGTVSGTVSSGGYNLTGTWYEGNSSGPFELTMAKSQGTFTGWWMYDNRSGDTTKYPWNSTRSPSPAVSWTGVWNGTDWNMTMTLIQINGSVSGMYLEEENATSGNVSGTVSNGGYNLTGTWSEENASGLLELTLAKSQDHFTGWWTFDNQTGPWNGVRSPGPAIVSSTPAPVVSWTGVWNDVDWNMTMTLAQTNGSVSGTYLEENATSGKISGTVSSGGYNLTGTWSEGAKNGPFELTMAKSQDHFTGWYMSDNQSADMTKYPWGLSVRSST